MFVFSNGSFKYRRLYFGGVVSDVGSVFMILLNENFVIFGCVVVLGFLGLVWNNLSVMGILGLGDGMGWGGGIFGYV